MFSTDIKFTSDLGMNDRKHTHDVNVLQRGTDVNEDVGCSMQAAIDSMTRSLALEWGYYGIRVSGIAPGWIGDTTGMTTISARVKHQHQQS